MLTVTRKLVGKHFAEDLVQMAANELRMEKSCTENYIRGLEEQLVEYSLLLPQSGSVAMLSSDYEYGVWKSVAIKFYVPDGIVFEKTETSRIDTLIVAAFTQEDRYLLDDLTSYHLILTNKAI